MHHWSFREKIKVILSQGFDWTQYSELVSLVHDFVQLGLVRFYITTIWTMWGKVLNHKLIHKCQKIPLNWLNSSACQTDKEEDSAGNSAFLLSLKESPLQGSIIVTLRSICFHTQYWDKHLAGEKPINLFSPVLHGTWGVGGEEKN